MRVYDDVKEFNKAQKKWILPYVVIRQKKISTKKIDPNTIAPSVA